MRIILTSCVRLQTPLQAVSFGRGSNLCGWKSPRHLHSSSTPREFSVKVEKSVQEFVSKIHGSKMSNYDRAIRYLQASSSTVGFQNWMSSKIEPSVLIPMTSEVFTPGIVYDLISELPGIDSKISQNLLRLIEIHMNEYGLFNFFTDKIMMGDNVDTTSVCLWALLKSNKVVTRFAKCIAKLIAVNCVTDSVFTNNSPIDGDTNKEYVQNVIRPFLPPFYASKYTVRLDACVMANAMRVLYFLKMHHLDLDTQNFIYDWLNVADKSRNRTYYYHSPDSLLYLQLVSNCLLVSEDKLKTHN